MRASACQSEAGQRPHSCAPATGRLAAWAQTPTRVQERVQRVHGAVERADTGAAARRVKRHGRGARGAERVQRRQRACVRADTSAGHFRAFVRPPASLSRRAVLRIGRIALSQPDVVKTLPAGALARPRSWRSSMRGRESKRGSFRRTQQGGQPAGAASSGAPSQHWAPTSRAPGGRVRLGRAPGARRMRSHAAATGARFPNRPPFAKLHRGRRTAAAPSRRRAPCPPRPARLGAHLSLPHRIRHRVGGLGGAGGRRARPGFRAAWTACPGTTRSAPLRSLMSPSVGSGGGGARSRQRRPQVLQARRWPGALRKPAARAAPAGRRAPRRVLDVRPAGTRDSRHRGGHSCSVGLAGQPRTERPPCRAQPLGVSALGVLGPPGIIARRQRSHQPAPTLKAITGAPRTPSPCLASWGACDGGAAVQQRVEASEALAGAMSACQQSHAGLGTNCLCRVVWMSAPGMHRPTVRGQSERCEHCGGTRATGRPPGGHQRRARPPRPPRRVAADRKEVGGGLQAGRLQPGTCRSPNPRRYPARASGWGCA